MRPRNIDAAWRIASGISMLDMPAEARELLADAVHNLLAQTVDNFARGNEERNSLWLNLARHPTYPDAEAQRLFVYPDLRGS